MSDNVSKPLPAALGATADGPQRRPAMVLAIAAIAMVAYLYFFLHAESQLAVAVLLALAGAAVFAAGRLGLTQAVEQAAVRRPGQSRLWALAGTLALIALFHESHF
ncbi:MAG: branched-chain amino acid ABC transporter permease, partial [Polaromonas sp.]